MEARARKFSSIKSIFALLTVNLLASSTAEYVHRHHHGIQSKIHVHPRFGDRSIRYCAFNQYFDDREGRCMIIPGGGIAISIDESTTCSTEALRGHPHRSRNYYICRKSNTILAECGKGKRFENRLKRCTIDANPSIDKEDYDSHHHPYDHLHLPACRRSGRFPVPQDNCTSYYTCTSNGFRFFRSIHKCPPSTGFDPFDKICTTERACDNDDLGSTTVADDRAEIFESTIGLIVATTAGRSLHKVPSIHTPKENYSLNKSTMRFTATSATPSPSTSGYDETKISVSFVTPNTFTTKKITTATSLPDSIDEVVGIARATRPTTKVYEHGGETSPFTSTTYVHSFGLSEQTNTSERSTVAFATNQVVDTSTANSVLSDNESTVNTSGTTDGILYNKYSDDYVTLRSDNAMRRRTKNESSTDTPATISTNNKNYEFTVATNEIVDTATTNSVLPENESTANTYGTNSDQFRQLSTNNKNDEFTDKTTIDDLRTRERDETRTSEANELGIGLQVSYSTESAVDNASEKWLFDKNIEGATSTIADEIPRRGITERELGTSPQVLLSGASSDATTRDIQYKEAQSITTPSGISSIGQSSIFIEEPEIKSTPERITLYDAVTLTTPVDSYASSGEVSWKILSSDGIGDTSISPTEIVDSTTVTLTSLTPRSNEATSIPKTNWTTEKESTITDRYHGSFSSFSTDRPDNEKSTTDGAEATMSTTESTYITEVTEKFESTPVTLTSLAARKDEATSIQDSNWMTEEKSTIDDRYHDTVRSSSTDKPDNEKSTTDGVESTMSTIEPTYMTEVTEKFDSTPVTRTSLITRNNEATSTTESEYISEVTEKFESTPVTLTSLTSRNDEATSIQDSNWTTEEKSTIDDRYHDTVRSSSTDKPDNEKSTTDGAESTMSTIEPTYMTEVTEKFDSTPVTPTWLTARNNEATSTTEPEFISEVTEKFVSTPVSPTSLTTRNNEATSTSESEYISEVTEKFESTPVTLTSLTSRNDETTSIQDSNWTAEEKSTIADRYHGSFSSFSTDRPDNEKSTTDGAESTMSTTEPTYITEVTEKFESTAVTLTSLTPRNDEATSIQDLNWTAEEKSTIGDRYRDTFRSFSTDKPDNEKSTTDGAESTMSTTEPTYMTEVTEKFDSTPVTPTWLTARNNEATSTTEPEFISEVTEKFDSTPVSPTSLTTRNNEATSTTEPEFISEVTEKFDSTPVSPTSLTTRNNEATSTLESEYISEITEKFESTPVTLTSLTPRNDEATSIQDSNWTTEEKSTIDDHYHDTFRSSSTDKPDNEKSTTDGAESTMSTIEPTYMTDLIEKFDSTAVTPTWLTARNNEATSTTEPKFISEVTEKFDSTPVSPTSLTTRNNEATSTSESEYISEITEKFESTPVTLTSLTPRNDEATSIQDSNWTTEEKSTIDDRYHDTVRSSSTDKPDNEKSTTDGAESTMSTIEPTYMTKVTEKFDSTPVTRTSLTARNNEATSTTEPEFISEVTEKFDSTPVALTSLGTRNNEATSTSELEYISEVTEKFGSTPVSPTSLTTRNNEATSTSESEYISEVTEKFDSTPVSPTSLTTRSNEATSIHDSNSTTNEESTIADRYHGTFSSFSIDTPDDEKSTSPGTQSAMSTTQPVHISEVTEKVGTHSGIVWKSSSIEDLITPIEQHQSTTGENSYQSFTYTENSASGASQFDIAQTTEDSISGMNIAVSTTSITPSASSEPSQLVSGQAQGWYTTLPHTFSSFFTDMSDNEKSTTAGTKSVMSTAEPVHISEIIKKAVTYLKINSSDNLFTTIEQHQRTTGEKPNPAFTYTHTLGASQFGIAQTTEDSNPEINVAVSITSMIPSVSSEPSQLQNGQTQGSYTSASNSSEYQTTVEPLAGSTNS